MVLDVENDSEAYDAVNEILRGQQRPFAPDSCLLDYAISEPASVSLEADSYEEGDAFNGRKQRRRQREIDAFASIVSDACCNASIDGGIITLEDGSQFNLSLILSSDREES